MSKEEKQEQMAQGNAIKNIAGEVDVIKHWVPVIAFISSIIGLTITITIFLIKYDSNHATKADVALVSKNVEAISKQVSNLQTTIKDLSNKFSGRIMADSIDRINVLKQVNTRIDENKTNIDHLFKVFEKRGVPAAFYTQKVSVSKDGSRQVQFIPHTGGDRK